MESVEHGSREAGTASLEGVLCLPFLLLLLALLFNMGYAYVTRIRLEGAARLAAEEYVLSPNAGDAETMAQDAFPTLSRFSVRIQEGGAVEINPGILSLFGFLSNEAGLVQLQAEAELAPPFGSVLSGGNAGVTMTYSRNTWTVSDLGKPGLTPDLIVAPMPPLLDQVLGGLLSLLGMRP